MKSIPLLVLLAIPAPAQAHVHDAHAMHANAPASARDSAVLRAQIEAVRAATECYRDHANAVKDGFRLFGQESPLMGEHWYRRDLVGESLDLQQPREVRLRGLPAAVWPRLRGTRQSHRSRSRA
jgi:hypothetical protein